MAALSLRHSLLFRFLGILLLTAAGLKIYGLSIGPLAQTGLFSAAWVQAGVIVFELLLGLWLLWGKYPVGAWLMVAATFVIFAVVSLHAGLVGQTSCGCFGAIRVNPWYAFSLDVLVLSLLALARPDLSPLWHNPRAALLQVSISVLGGLLGIGLIFGAMAGLTSLWFGSPAAALAYMRGETLSVWPTLADLGTGEPGEKRQLAVELTNWTDQPIRVIGGTKDCSCQIAAELPLTIPPKETRPLTVYLRFAGKPGQFTRKVGLLTDQNQLRAISFRVTGLIRNIP